MDVIRKPLWQRILRVLLFCIVAMLAIGGFSFTLLHFVGSETELRTWLLQIKTPLLFWRLALYAVIVFSGCTVSGAISCITVPDVFRFTGWK